MAYLLSLEEIDKMTQIPFPEETALAFNFPSRHKPIFYPSSYE